MKRFIIAGLALLVLISTQVQAEGENPFDELVGQQLDEISDAIASPVSSIFSAAITGGWYRSAETHKLFGFELGARANIVQISSGESAVFDSAEGAYFPAGALQGALGLPYGFEVTVRGFSFKFEEASISLFGMGLKKNFKSLIPIPAFPDVAAFVAYQKFKATYTTFTLDATDWFVEQGYTAGSVTASVDAGNLINSSHWTLGLIASKKFSWLIFSVQPYLGFTWDSNKLKYEWTVQSTQPDLQSWLTTPLPVSDVIPKNTTRFTLGLDVSPLPLLHVFGDYNIGTFKSFSAGLALSIR